MRTIILILVASLWLSACFPKKAGPRLAHFYAESPAINAVAPKFTLLSPEGTPITLTNLIGSKPVVLQLGSHSCPVYRYRRFGMSTLYRDYGDIAHFLLVYTLEAHPKGAINPYSNREWVSSFNYLTNTLVSPHVNAHERSAMASFSTSQLRIAYPVVVDDMDNSVWKAYGRAPSAAFVIDQHGRIADRMPWVDPERIAKTLDRLRLTGPSSSSTSTPKSAE